MNPKRAQRIPVAHEALHVVRKRSRSRRRGKVEREVYEKPFLTPGSDPWLGLFSTDVYTALDNGGVVKPR
jgi:hypothetical protein